MRWVRVLWLLVFLVPLGLFAGRFCYVNLVDPAYHTLVWLHEQLPIIVLVLAATSAVAALLRFVRIQARLGDLLALRSPTPQIVQAAFERQSGNVTACLDVIYIDVPAIFCFTSVGGRVLLSSGFANRLDADELKLVAYHEALHVGRGDPLKALLWHLFFAALIVPGFERVEDALYVHRERGVNRLARRLDPAGYEALLQHFKNSMCNRAPEAAFRSLPARAAATTNRALAWATVPVALLALLAASHVIFVENLPYLQSHHC